MDKHLEIKTYIYGGIRVMVKIDYDANQVSLIDRADLNNHKKWIFAGREPEFLNGWINILDAMKYAMEESFGELTKYLKAKEKEREEMVEAVLIEASGIVKERSKKKK